jgi:hypothetical protein
MASAGVNLAAQKYQQTPPKTMIVHPRMTTVPKAINTSITTNAAILFRMPVFSMIAVITLSKKGAAAMAKLSRIGRMKCELIHSPT